MHVSSGSYIRDYKIHSFILGILQVDCVSWHEVAPAIALPLAILVHLWADEPGAHAHTGCQAPSNPFAATSYLGLYRARARPVPIILFFLPIILFRISQNILPLFLRIDPIILNYSHKNSGKLNDYIAT